MNQYIFEKSVYSGTGSELSLCRLNSTGETVVVKQLLDPSNLDNFEAELEVLRIVNSHPNIVKLQDAFFFKETAFLVYRYYPFGDLFHLVQEKGPLKEFQAILLLQQISSALQYARKCGFFHCDVKPENILVQNDSEFVLADWDLARKSHQRKTSMHNGSALVMAPEVILGQLHENSDVYSLGCLMHYCLTGGRAYGLSSSDSPHKKILTHLETNYDASSLNCSLELKGLVKRMMQKNPEKRASLKDVQNFFQCFNTSYQDECECFEEDFYLTLDGFIDSGVRFYSINKSKKRIEKYMGFSGDLKKESLVVSHRVILSYLGDVESQIVLSGEYKSNPLLSDFVDKSDAWLARSECCN